MMYPRLMLLREFLCEDGSIWVTIDDNEAHYLKVVMDEVFGRGNFLTSFIWKKAYGGGAKSRWYVGLHKYVLCFTKDLEQFPDLFLPPDPDAEGGEWRDYTGYHGLLRDAIRIATYGRRNDMIIRLQYEWHFPKLPLLLQAVVGKL